MNLRALIPPDEPLLWEMLCIAAHEESLEHVQNQPNLTRYVSHWGRPDDFGFGAFESEIGIGAAWCRLWDAGDEGYGFLTYAIPELAVAIAPEYQGQGIGTELIHHCLEHARGIYPAISLSVRGGSRAESLYHHLGFETVPGTEVTNRVGSTSLIMVKYL